jgi:hypothetical protein
VKTTTYCNNNIKGSTTNKQTNKQTSNQNFTTRHTKHAKRTIIRREHYKSVAGKINPLLADKFPPNLLLALLVDWGL